MTELEDINSFEGVSQTYAIRRAVVACWCARMMWTTWPPSTGRDIAKKIEDNPAIRSRSA
ncbi:MAG: hypothetical protein R3A10_07020 [Caldilineaceae bacterium]